jgi:hypothetical protein
MKRLLFVVVLLAAPALFAETSDRSVLLAPNGTLYTIESQRNAAPTSEMQSTRFLSLTIQNGVNVIHTNVPASLTGGNNWQPELAFDDASATLFVFWLRSQNSVLGTNELLFCTFQNGKWNAASSVEDIPYHFRFNLRIGVTRSVQLTDPDTGAVRQVPGLSVHAVWWDESSSAQVARYAMLSIDRGVVTDVYRRDLLDFVNSANLRQFDLDFDSQEILRHSIVFESPEHDTVDVVFGDLQSNTVHRLTLRPVLQSRVRIPIGVRDTSYPGPKHQIAADTSLSGISTPPDRLVYYYKTGDAVKYLLFQDGAWSEAKSIAVTADVSAETAVAALQRLVRGD